MSKPVLFYTFMLGYSETGYRPMAVTSVKGNFRKQYYGTDINNGTGTHARENDCVGRFDTLEQAKAAIGEIAKLRTFYAKLREPFRAAIINNEREERNAVAAVIEKSKELATV